MKKTFKKILASSLAGILAASVAFTNVPMAAMAAEESTEEYEVFVAFGGDKDADGDWGYGYAGGDVADDAGFTVTNGTITSGGSTTVSIEFDNPVVYTWYTAPVVLAEEVSSADFTVETYIDGKLVDTDMSAGDNWWYEQTGDYDDTIAIRLAGGYNEWGGKYIAESPTGFTKLEYKITANSIMTGEVGFVNIHEATDEYDMFVAFGGDAEAENDWGLAYDGETETGCTATNAKIKVGETVTVGLEFENPVVYTWYTAPVILAENVAEADFTVKVLIDGEEVAVDMTAGDNWWYEQTGGFTADQAIRIAGGYNEWGTRYLAESPSGFTKLEFEITANKIMVGELAAPEEVAIDLNGEFNAYLGLQTPNWTYRDAWNSANGIGSDTWGDFIFGNETQEKYGKVVDTAVTGNGTYTVSITDFGSIFADDFATAGQDYFNLLYISTDIPKSDKITVTNVILKIDGKEIQKYDEAIIDEEDKDYIKILIQNIWADGLKEINYYEAPTESLEMTFTISGFAYDNEAAASDEAAPADEATATDAAPAEEATVEAPQSEGGVNGALVGGIIGLVVVGGGAAAFATSKKKKDN